jgi:ABC-type transport system substrate-binding protein
LSTVLTVALLLTMAWAVSAGEAPKRGGTLNFGVVAEPPTTDCHATTTFAMVHPVAPQYSTLLVFTGPHDNLKIEGDLAESWEVAKDGLSYTFRLRKGVKFHDGSDFTSEDIKATYERIINPSSWRDLGAQGAAPGHQGDRDARSPYGRLQDGAREHVDGSALRVALQLRLQRQEAEGKS